MKVTKEVTFDSAHMLSNYQGKCANLHGHTYKLQVSIEAPLQSKGNEECMVMDFNNLKNVIDTVTSAFDHAIIFSDTAHRSAAENALMAWANTYGMAYVVIPTGKSTSEGIALDIKSRLSCYMSNVRLPDITVRVWETPTSFAEA